MEKKSEIIEKVLKISGLLKLNPSQKKVVDAGLLGDSNMVIASPTASGKTLMAEIAIFKAIKEKKKKAIYLAPLVALASEKYESFRKKYEPLGLKVALSVGDFDSSDPWLRDYDLIVCSNEKMDSLLRHRIDWMNDIGLIISDEVHLINDQSRGPTLEIVLTKLRNIPGVRIIALSATIKNASELAEWLQAKLVVSDWRPVELLEGIAFGNEIEFVKKKENLSHEQLELAIAKSTLKLGKQAIFFVATRKLTESLAENLSKEVLEFLKPDEKKELDKISEKIINILEKPTEQCKKISNYVKGGVAFHHAGLVGKQKSLIEENFKKGIIKFIVATPTLAMGVSLPAFRVIVRDAKRYYPRLGSVYIPVLEYKQMVGRAGRPEWDDHGEGIIVAKNEKEARDFYDHYINGETEEIYSKLAVEPILRTHILALISSGICKNEKELFGFFSRTFYAHQYGDDEILNSKIREVVRKLAKWKMIKSGKNLEIINDFFQPADEIGASEEKLETTLLGKRVSELYLDPFTADVIVNCLANRREKKPISFLHMVANTIEMGPASTVKQGEYETIAEELEKNREFLLAKVPTEWDDGYEEFMKTFKTALLLQTWMNESGEDYIFEAFKMAPGELRSRLEIADWIIYSSQELGMITNKGEIVIELKKLRTRLKYGVKEELLPLVKLKGIGRARARKLYDNGIKSFSSLQKAPKEKIVSLLGEKVAKSIMDSDKEKLKSGEEKTGD
jgi:helicase